jgi:hypothetical protein
MAIDSSNDHQITSEMSQRFEHFNINDQECHGTYESAPVSGFWPSEQTFFHFDSTGEPNAKSGFYVSESPVFDPNSTIQDTTDGSEGSSVYVGPPLKTSLNGVDWPLVEVGTTVSISDLQSI